MTRLLNLLLLLGHPLLSLVLPDAQPGHCDVANKSQACSRNTGEVAYHTFLLLLGLLMLSLAAHLLFVTSLMGT